MITARRPTPLGRAFGGEPVGVVGTQRYVADFGSGPHGLAGQCWIQG